MNPETFVAHDDVHLCVQTVGDPADPAVLLCHGACASMLWWEDDLCRRIAQAGHFVIRYDQRDTGRSTSFPVGHPGYAVSDLVADALAILDALDVERAHVVGRSMAGGLALSLGVDHPSRVASLTFMSTTTGDVAMGDLTVPERGDDVAAYAADMIAAYAGESPHLDRAAVRALVEVDLARTRDVEAMLVNHFEIDFDAPSTVGFGDVTQPTLVVQGSADPVFGPEHGEALRDAVPGARLLVMEGMGHDLPPALFDPFVSALTELTSSVGR